MEFDCPACGTAHAFPDDQIPPEGIVVACTRCSHHITLTQRGVVAPPSPTPRPAEHAPKREPPPGPPPPRRRRPPEPEPEPEPEPNLELDLGPMLEAAGGDTTSQSPAVDDAGTGVDQAPAPPMTSPPKRRSPRPRSSGEMKRPPSFGSARIAPPSVEPEPPPPLKRRESKPKPPQMEPPKSRTTGLLDAAQGPMADVGPAAVDVSARAAERVAETATIGESVTGKLSAGRSSIGSIQLGAGTEGDVWTWRDLPKALLGLADRRRIAVGLVGFWIALNIDMVFGWLGGWLARKVLAALGSGIGYAAKFGVAGVSIFVWAMLAYMCHRGVIEGRGTSAKSALAWTKTNVKNVIGTPLFFIVLVATAGGLIYGIGWLGRVPWAGPIIVGIASPVLVALSLFAGVAIIVSVYSLPLYVPVIYNEKTGPRQTLTRVFDLFRQNPFRVVGFNLLAWFAIGLAYVVTVYPAVAAARFVMTYAATRSMAGDFFGMVAEAPGPYASMATMGIGPGDAAGLVETNFGHQLGGIFWHLGGSLVLALMMTLAAITAVTAGSIIYSAIHKLDKAAR